MIIGMDDHFTSPFTGYSMYPCLKPGDRLVVRKVPLACFEVGDMIAIRNTHGHLTVHRLIKRIGQECGITKGDALLAPDLEQVDLSKAAGKVELIVRGRQLISVASGPRSKFKRLYVTLSRMGLTPGALELKAKNVLKRLLPFQKRIEPNHERNFILSILKGHEPEWKANMDWTRLADISRKEGVAGILYGYLKEKETPPPALAPFENFYRATAAMNFIHLQAIKNLESALSDKKIQVLTLKGASLLDMIYPKVGLRSMEDLDLMVQPKNQKEFEEVLIGLGYKKDPWISHIFAKENVTLDLHSHALNTDRIDSRADLFPAGMETIWEKSAPWNEGFQWVRRPDHKDNILLLSQHLMKHSFSRLIWLVDIIEIVRGRDHTFWTELFERADQLKQKKPLSYVLYLSNGLFGFKPPKEFELEALLGEYSVLERNILEMKLSGQSPDYIGHLLSLFCLPGFRKRVLFGWETLFPKKEIVKQEFSRFYGSRWRFFYPARLLQMAFLVPTHTLLILGSLIRRARSKIHGLN